MSISTAAHKLEGEMTPHLETTPVHIKGILAATDFSDQATLAVKYAARMANQLRCRLHVLYTVTPQLYIADTAVLTSELQKIEIERGQQELHEYLSRIGEVRTTRHEEIALCGPTADTITELVELKGIDLVVMGSHGRRGLEKMALGSVAEAAIRGLHCPVLVVGPRCIRRFGPVTSMTLAANLPFGSLRAAQYATALARKAHAGLTVLHVLPERVEHLGISSIAVEENALKELRQLTPHDPELHKHIHFEIAIGKPADEIVRVAKHSKAGMIVMGAKEHRMLADHAPWATLSEVIRKSHCPVLVVQPHAA